MSHESAEREARALEARLYSDDRRRAYNAIADARPEWDAAYIESLMYGAGAAKVWQKCPASIEVVSLRDLQAEYRGHQFDKIFFDEFMRMGSYRATDPLLLLCP